MVTIRAGKAAPWICLLALLGGCSREQQDWRAAEAADSIEAYGHFIQRHPDSELVSQAHMRIAQLGEDRDWQHAGSADTVDAYRDFLRQHPTGKWAQEARIRIENFSLSEQAGTDAGTRSVPSAEAVQAHSAARPSGGSAQGSQAATPSAMGAHAPGAGPAAAGGQAATAGPAAAGAQAATTTPSAGVAQASSAVVASALGTQPAVAATGQGTHGAGLVYSPSKASGSGPPPSVGSTALPGEAAVPLGSQQGASAGAANAGGRAIARAWGDASTAGGSGNATAGTMASGPMKNAATSGAAGYGIQLGAFTSEAGANNQWRALTARFGPQLQGLQQHIVPADTPSGRIYRLQAQVGPEARARGICELLRTQSQDCVAVLPH